MNDFFFYADPETRAILSGSSPKVLLIGGDFGYSNFGDVLQLKGAIEFHKNYSRYTPVVIFNLFAISSECYIASMKKLLGVEAILFLSDKTVSFENAPCDAELVEDVTNTPFLHLYGGGMLNSMWGEYVLERVEKLIQRCKINYYAISGQQIEKGFEKRFEEHTQAYNPFIVGVRDYDSIETLKSTDTRPLFSFDDATEQLLEIAKKVPLKKSSRFLGHINLSAYTHSESKKMELVHNFALFKKQFPTYEAVLFNAYNDKRHIVCDTLSSIVKLENDFPYDHYTLIDGSALAYFGEISDMNQLAVSIALSSSYHTTLLMHLCNTPCYLVSNNPYYDQKQRALDVQGTLEEFIQNPTVPDYSSKLKARRSWIETFRERIWHLPMNQIETVHLDNTVTVPIIFHYKSDEIASVYEVQWHESNAKQYWAEFQKYQHLYNVEKSKSEALYNETKRLESLVNSYWEKTQQLEISENTYREEAKRLLGLEDDRSLLLSSSSCKITKSLRFISKLIRKTQ